MHLLVRLIKSLLSPVIRQLQLPCHSGLHCPRWYAAYRLHHPIGKGRESTQFWQLEVQVGATPYRPPGRADACDCLRLLANARELTWLGSFNRTVPMSAEPAPVLTQSSYDLWIRFRAANDSVNHWPQGCACGHHQRQRK